jgi:hypothetical protein
MKILQGEGIKIIPGKDETWHAFCGVLVLFTDATLCVSFTNDKIPISFII